MIVLRDNILTKFKQRFPAMVDSINPFVGRLGPDSDDEISYLAPGLLLAILPLEEPPRDQLIPWELHVKFSVGIGVAGASAQERDNEGWKLALQVAQVVYRNCWGFDKGVEITPAVIESISKNVRISSDGTSTGMYYWTVDFSNYANFDTLLKGV